MDEYTFKHCHKGHYYQGEECPYCKAQTTPYDNIVEEPVQDMGHLKTCPNGHAYGPRLNYCPYCGETEVCGQIDLVTGWPGVLKFVFDRELFVRINNNSEKTVSELEIGYLYGGGYNTYYGIVGLSDFNYKSIIQIGRHTFTGKEFIKCVDFMIGVKEVENHQ